MSNMSNLKFQLAISNAMGRPELGDFFTTPGD
jgi:hypothetical protein